ncbi:valine--tRNA ligase [Acetohalobium arabaticum]|uniref:Valine--tRNA ligase n=1 Tax=Acetohalobium arabaticum (strain ATCC 49924 / DSM 5501 / Z-7288) TaxID=574087 RepID=D9QUZ9_ACEAZ|nr:valine--tRNA ligase [Acetohalobium arabaticum]ADL12058.1 valyl-tRNA synthetase [Acetohalobium arabaticum DSM 5501]
MSKKKMATTYDPAAVEDKWYEYWMENDCFGAEVDEDKESFTIVMPPPNVTGQLHIGHALDNTLQDILIRWKRMQGYSALWIPGTDHASIATEVKVVNKLREEEGLEKDDVGREGFLKRAWDWKEEYGGRITDQLKKLGTSCDWSRERFTMDEGCSKAVKEAFIQLYEKDLIYRGDYIINWCPDCGTTLSDIEVEHEEIPGHFYHIKYDLKDSDDHLVVATTRPETMLGDTAIAVNPSDERYQDLIGKTAILPVVGRELPIIADEFVDSDFGTGLVKVTPAHDPNDFEMGQRNDLEIVKVIDDQAKMTAEAGKYEGMDRYECREQLVEDLKETGQLIEIEEHDHSVGHCYRCDTVIEPLVSKQWFVKMDPLAKPAIEAVEESETDFVPDRFTKVYRNWMENIRDWCISRQLWWGHRIPVWYCQDCEEEIVAREEPASCPECGGDDLKQDEDVLDTWFSSGLWPFSTLGWPEETEELEYYYPTSVLVTGRDIIFFWVARMIFSGLEFMEETPFSDVLVHGLVRDAQGRKMSKSLGNGIDPIEFIDEYGADTLRFTLVTGNTPGNDMRFRQEKVEASRNFVNKIWNASRFVLMNLEDFDPEEVEELDYTLADKWIISRLNETAQEVTRTLDKYQIGNAAQTLYDFIWNEFCDWYIELIKPRLYQDEDQVVKETAQYVVSSVLEQSLRLLHPFMPFVTEEIWQKLPYEGETIMTAIWPDETETETYEAAEEKMEVIMNVITAVRNIRNEMKVNPGKEIEAILEPENDKKEEILTVGRDYIMDLGKISNLKVEQDLDETPEKASTAITDNIEVILPLAGMVDLKKEIERLKDELDEVKYEIERAEGKLANEGFVNNAPEELVEEEREKVKDYKAKKEQLLERLEMLKE